jgi:hypothetical protein
MKKPLAMLAIASVLGLGVVGLTATAASAHVPAVSATCSGVVLSGVSYDGSKTNTWTATVGGVTTSGTFGASFTQTIPVAQGGASTAWSATVTDADHTPAYTKSDSGTVGPCGTPVLPDAVWPAGSSTCNTYTLPALADYEKYPLMADNVTRYTAGTHALVGTVTVDAHTLASDTTHKQGDHVYSFTASTCPTTPPVPVAVGCTALGTPSFEAPDHFATKTDAGYTLYNLPLVAGAPAGSTPDGHPVDLIFPANGNLQGVSSITYPSTGVVGNGIFFRFILDLSADGGSAYNSFSIVGQPVNQSSVANVGSKAALLGKTVAQVAALYPHNVIKAYAIQTGSSYVSGDGGTVTGLSAAGTPCTVSFTTTVSHNNPTPPSGGVNTGDAPVSPLYPAAALLAATALLLAFRKRLARKF